MKKYAPPPERDPVPAMFAGDEPPPPAPVVPAEWKEAAATQPDDLSLVTRGVKLHTWIGSLFLILAGLTMVREWPRVGAAVMGIAALWGLYSLVSDWHSGNHLKLFRLTDEGITLTVRHRWGGKPRDTRIIWAEMRKYRESVDADWAFLRVEDDFGGTIELRDHPGRAAEFVRRFAEQAQRHGIPSVARAWSKNDEEEEENPDVKKGLGCLFWLLGAMMINEVGDLLGVQSGLTTVLALALPGLALYLWNTLEDPEAAAEDRTSRNPMARLRRWLRTVLGFDAI